MYDARTIVCIYSKYSDSPCHTLPSWLDKNNDYAAREV